MYTVETHLTTAILMELRTVAVPTSKRIMKQHIGDKISS